MWLIYLGRAFTSETDRRPKIMWQGKLTDGRPAPRARESQPASEGLLTYRLGVSTMHGKSVEGDF